MLNTKLSPPPFFGIHRLLLIQKNIERWDILQNLFRNLSKKEIHAGYEQHEFSYSLIMTFWGLCLF